DTIPNCLGEFREIRESKERTRGQKGQPRYPCAREWVAPFAPGHESGVRDSRGRPAVLVVWVMRPWRGIVLKKISTREIRCNFKPRGTDHTEIEHRPTRADSGHGGEPPVLSPWSIPTGELTTWPPQHRSKPTAAMPRRAPGRKPRGERPAPSSTPSHTA